jgi:hypothetical protein
MRAAMTILEKVRKSIRPNPFARKPGAGGEASRERGNRVRETDDLAAGNGGETVYSSALPPRAFRGGDLYDE